MKKLTATVRKLMILLIGVPITIAGLVLIPLPGPGIVITLVGLYILSFEFMFVKNHKDNYQEKLKKIINQQYTRYKERMAALEDD